jgi:hypothetical protein
MSRSVRDSYVRVMSNTSPSMSRKANPDGLTMSHALYSIGIWQVPASLDRVLPDIDLDGHRDSGQHPAAATTSAVTKAGAR